MKGQTRLRGVEHILQLAHAALAVREQPHDFEPRRVRKRVEPAGRSADVGKGGRGHEIPTYQITSRLYTLQTPRYQARDRLAFLRALGFAFATLRTVSLNCVSLSLHPSERAFSMKRVIWGFFIPPRALVLRAPLRA